MADSNEQFDPVSSDDENENTKTSKSTLNHSRKKAYHFKDTDDINLLREVLIEKPVGKEGAKRWKRIFERLSIPITDYRALKRRFDHLLACYKADNFKSLRGSGLEETYDEKMQLLTDVSSQLEDWKKEENELTTTTKKKLEETHARAQVIRDAALNNLKDPDQESTIPSNDEEYTPRRAKKFKSADVLEILKSSEEKDRAHQEQMVLVEKKKLDLREREITLQADNDRHRRDMEAKKLEMEERRLEMEQKRFEKDIEERTLLLKLLQKKL